MIIENFAIYLNRLIKGDRHEADKATVKLLSSRVFKSRFPYKKSSRTFYEMMDRFKESKTDPEFQELLDLFKCEYDAAYIWFIKEEKELKRDMEIYKRGYKRFFNGE